MDEENLIKSKEKINDKQHDPEQNIHHEDFLKNKEIELSPHTSPTDELELQEWINTYLPLSNPDSDSETINETSQTNTESEETSKILPEEKSRQNVRSILFERKQLPTENSELAFCISDTEFVKSKMNGKEYWAGKHAIEMRKRCMKEHLGLLPGMRTRLNDVDEIDVDDPVSESFFHLWCKIADRNTQIFEDVFNVLPTDKVQGRKIFYLM
uniref:Uncharacterized protein n=1 Tax=Panagrolaimus davidi TaxID=227884 RepID=A0A914QMJ3_9BILA